MTRRHAEINNIYSTYIFCGIIPLCNFPYRNRVHSITLIPFEIMSQKCRWSKCYLSLHVVWSCFIFVPSFIMSILLFSSLFVYLLLTILLLYLTKSHVCWRCRQRRKKLISCKIVDQIVLSYPTCMRRKTERKYFCSVHAKSLKHYKS